MPVTPQRDKTRQQATEEVIWDSSRPSFVQLPEWLLFHPDISDGAKVTWLALASYADRQGEAFPGVTTIGDRRSIGRRAIFRHLDQLEDAGALRRQARYRETDGGRTSTLYVLAWAHPLTPKAPPLSPEDPDSPPAEQSHDTPPCQKRHRGTPVSKKTPPRVKNVRGARVKKDTPRTRPSNELTPVVPNSTLPDAANHDSSRGAQPPSNPPPRSKKKLHGSESLNPRARGTNPRAMAQSAASEAQRSDRLASARTYGARMASVDPLPWSSEEFQTVLTEEHPTDAEYVKTALAAYVEASERKAAAEASR